MGVLVKNEWSFCGWYYILIRAGEMTEGLEREKENVLLPVSLELLVELCMVLFVRVLV